MILSVILSGNTSDWGILVFLGLAIYAWMWVDKNIPKHDFSETQPEDFKNIQVEKPDVVSDVSPVVEESIIENTEVVEEEIPKSEVIDLGCYEGDLNDNNFFTNLSNKEFKIRLLKKAPYFDKDCWKISLSFPHGFTNESIKIFSNLFFHLSKITIDDKHSILVRKSPACKWDDLENELIKALFLRMHNIYAFLYEKTKVFIQKVPNADILVFNLRLETLNHLDLGAKLISLKGIIKDVCSRDFPLCMDHEGNYSFNLEKGRAFTWEEIFPEIEKVFNEYFPAGVEFTGAVPTKKSESSF